MAAIHHGIVLDLKPATSLDRGWQLVYGAAFPLVRLWWRIRRRPHLGALVAIWVDDALLLVRSSYKAGWSVPGGGVEPGETPAQAGAREVREEIGLVVSVVEPSVIVRGDWDGRPETVHFFDVRLRAVPPLRLDNREVIGARLVRPEELGDLPLTGPVAAYLQRRGTSIRERSR